MKRSFVRISFLAFASAGLFACGKSGDGANVSKPLTVIGQAISSDTLPLKDGSGNAIPLKGTMLSGKTYHIMSNVSINAGDTLYVQPGVTVLVHGNGAQGTSPMFLVNGTIISDGTKDQPNTFTVYETATTPKSNSSYTTDASTDPAYKGYWSGFQGTTTCNLMAFRWTHIEYTGGPYGANNTLFGKAEPGDPTPTIYMAPTGAAYGKLIVEDSWLFGSLDDCIGKCQHVYVSLMRNTLNKLGGQGGEGINLKNDVYGDMAYNFCYGVATNGLKTAGIDGSSTVVNIYNNTLVNCGFRQKKATRNGSINTETNAGGFIYNNIIVNCKQGLRITFSSEKGLKSDTLNTSYNNNLTYVGNSVKSGNDYLMLYIEPKQFTKKQSNDINGYVNGADSSNGVNLGSNVVDTTKYNPQFRNYDVVTNSKGTSYLNSVIPTGADFHLSSSSQAANAGVYRSGTGVNAYPSKPAAKLLVQYGFPMTLLANTGGVDAANITIPNKDLGAFPSDGTGNQHTY
ncbi:hypothetical protein SAMN05421788_105136 [Filimonas lacunae]|uniref:Right handed beta helix region n=1 Tax=Filimonas lacunae TaxID=477680 RepID=A0A173MD12_9BACT|nr:hypothetical protein [Filimonas lacunae]BAV05410.1 hypothetical protein FLA_1417 [Filimonas lacunae]SIT21342.1 hypothetical protein SAMN05421788_105136 [Filimonas lacunae]